MPMHPLMGYAALAIKGHGAGFSFSSFIEHFFAVIGIISSILGILAFFTGLTWQPTVKRWIASLKLDEKIAGQEKKRDSLEDVVTRLQSQIDNDVPREAKRISISDRMDSLTESLGAQYKEYSKLEKDLSRLTSETGQLEKPIRQSIERAVMPRYRLKERKERELRFLLGLVLVLVVLPSYLSPNVLIYGYFFTIFNSENYTRSALFATVMVGALVVSVPIVLVSTRWVAPRIKKAPLVRRLGIAAVAIAAISFTLVGLYLINQSSYYNSDNYSYGSPSTYNSIGIACIAATLLLGVILTAIWAAARPLLRRVRLFPTRGAQGYEH